MIKSNTSVTFLINFIEVLKPKLTEYQRLLKLVKKYLHVSNLNKKYVQKVLSTDEKEMIKFLDAFLLELTRNYSKILKANSIMKSFNTSQVEESDLYTSISLKTYNEQVDAYNKLITEFDLLRNYLKKGKLINSNGQLLLLEVFNGEFRELVGSKRDEGYNLWKALSSKTDELKLIGNDATLLQIEKASRDPDSEIAMKRLERRVVNLSAFDSVEPKSIRRSKNRRSRRTFIYICKPDDIPPIQRVEIEEDLLPLSLQHESAQDLARLPLKKVQKSDLDNSLLPKMERKPIYRDSKSFNSEHEYQSIDELVKKQSTQDLTGLPSKKIKKYGLDNSVLQQMEENPRGSWTSEHQYEVPKEPIDKKSAYDLARLRLKKIKKPGLQTSNLEHEYQSFDELKTKESEFPQSDSGYVSPDKMKSNSTFKDSLSKFAQYLSKLPLQECCLLPNANKNPTYFMETKRFMLKNSCGFDSIAQILLANVTDYPNFKNASQQNSQVIDLILKLRAGPCSKAASLRDDYLVSKNIALAKSDGKAPSLVIDLFGTILGVWVKYFDELPSAYRHFTCHPENRSKKSAFEIVKFDPTKKISIKEELNGFESDKLWCNLCGKMSETYFELQNYLFIDLTISAGNKKYKCKLNMFPEKLNFLKTKFRLAGVIEGDSEHFKSYVRRINGDWELYDDLKERVTKCFAFYVIAPEALVYIRE
ncbi:uncharacterized protein LOC141525177 isoform X1 [Cotesia typhae]|uniref:uncharacterized protein LOC141525177 isoform X1 n=1 Tax=Cotesia typhae TaxID=2053667 RepID=UPI003D681947